MIKNLFKLACLVLLALSIPVETQAATDIKPLIIIDAGHGGKYTGTAGYSGSKTGYYEEHANLEVSFRLRNVLQAKGYEVKMTRTTDAHFSNISNAEDLKARTIVSNSMASGRNDNTIFISVHHNATSTPTYYGYETYYFDSKYASHDYPPDPMQIEYSPQSARLAYLTHSSVINSGANKEGRGIVPYSFYVTRNAQVPAILVEVDYMSNPIAEAKIKTSTFQQGIANAIGEGVDKFFNIYLIKDYQGKTLKTFTTKAEALTYANANKNVTVFDKKAGVTIFNNIVYDYRAYHISVDLAQTKFFTEQEAINYSANWRNTRVVHHPTGEVRWSNYIPKKYDILDSNKQVVSQYYQQNIAEAKATSLQQATLVDSVTNSTLWSSVLPQSFEVRHKVKGTIKAFYDQKLAVNYAALWPGTTVYDTSKKTVVYTNPTQTTLQAVSETISAESRYLTAIEISKSLYPSGFPSTKAQKTVVLSTAFEYADALSAGPLAMHYGNSPILLNSDSKLNNDVLAEIKRLKATKVIFVGGEVALSKNVEIQLKEAIPTLTIERLAGETRYETNAVINSKLPRPNGIFIASGNNFPDALAATSIAVTQGWHIVLSDGKNYSDEIHAKVYSKPTVIVGGNLAISTELETKIKERAGSDYVTRLAGEDRYGTNAALINHFNSTFKSPAFVVSTGTNYPDALVSSALSGKHQAPLFLVGNTLSEALQPTLASYLDERVTTTSLYTGGIVPLDVKTKIDQLK